MLDNVGRQTRYTYPVRDVNAGYTAVRRQLLQHQLPILVNYANRGNQSAIGLPHMYSMQNWSIVFGEWPRLDSPVDTLKEWSVDRKRLVECCDSVNHLLKCHFLLDRGIVEFRLEHQDEVEKLEQLVDRLELVVAVHF